MSDFGPANAVGGVWECPDLFPLAVDGDPAKTKWVHGGQPQPRRDPGRLGRAVLRRRLRRHALHRRRTSPAPTRRPPVSSSQDFDGSDVWRLDDDRQRVRRRPRAGHVARPQGGVGGYLGSGLANSFHRRGPRHRHADLARVHDHARATSTSSSAAASTRYDPTSVDAPPPAGLVSPTSRATPTARLDGDRRRSPARGPPAGTIGDQNERSSARGPPAREHLHRPRQRHRARSAHPSSRSPRTTSTSSSAAATTPTPAPRPTSRSRSI